MNRTPRSVPAAARSHWRRPGPWPTRWSVRARRSRSSPSPPPATARPRRSPRSASGCSPRRCATRSPTDAIDVAVHSYKDLPTAPDPRLSLAAVPLREDPRDALVARDGLTLGELPTGSTVGTGSPRRAAQLEALGLGLEVVPIARQRGHPDPQGHRRRARRRRAGPCRHRPARPGRARSPRCSTRSRCCPRPRRAHSQWSAGSTTSTPNTSSSPLWTTRPRRAAVAAERAMLAALEAGCSAPVGALADVVEDLGRRRRRGARVVLRLSLRGVAATPENGDLLRASATGDLTAAEELGRALAAELLDLGGRRAQRSREA